MFKKFHRWVSGQQILKPECKDCISRTLVGNKIVDHLEACPHCSNYIFILDLAPGFIGFGKDNCKTRQETFKFGDLVHLILEIYGTQNVFHI